MKKWIAAGGLLIAVLGSWAFYFEPSSLRVTHHRLAIPGWPGRAGTLRVALLADLHVGSPSYGREKLHEVVSTTQRLRPDLVLLAGDFVIHGVPGGTFVPPEDVALDLRGLEAPLGVYAVLGNHDWWLDAERVRLALEREGIPVLDDRALRLSHRGASFWLAGLADFWEGDPDVEGTLSSIPEDTPILVFTHNPDVFPRSLCVSASPSRDTPMEARCGCRCSDG